jgi:RNA polymerase sigma-70 factor (ECF subfamily)
MVTDPNRCHIPLGIVGEIMKSPSAQVRPDSEHTQGLLGRVAAGQPDAVGELLALHRPALRSFVELHMDRTIRARVDPSDVVQEAMADVARRLSDFLERRPMPFHVWARRTAFERLLNARRSHRAARRDVGREAGPCHSSLAVARSLVSAGPSPGEQAEARERAALVAEAVAALDEPDREILLMRLAEDLPYEEVGLLLEVSAAAARQRYSRAMLRLEAALAARGIGGNS